VGGRFRVVRTVKRTNGVETYFGIDEVDGARVVIKTSEQRRVAPGARLRLDHEALVLRRLKSPWAAPLLAVGAQGELFYLVMEHVPGTPLDERLRQGPLSLRDSLRLAVCLLMALRDVHEQGVLHRDLKPANIIVTGESRLERATLIDFGLSHSDWLDLAIRDHPVGTARYLSPEQAGLLEQKPDCRSDLYSAGAVLFECLAGRPPFEAESVGELLWQHMAVRPPSVRTLRPEVPRALDDAVTRLLRKDPRDRYQSAEGALADLQRIEEALERGDPDPPVVIGLRDRRRVLTEPSFVGRVSELEALDRQLRRASSGQGGLVLLEAESGGGKSRLLTELCRQAHHPAPLVLHGQGIDQAAQRPFQILAGVAAGILAQCKASPSLGPRLREALGPVRARAACTAIPELSEALGEVGGDDGPETFGPQRTREALSALLDALGAPSRPVLVILDDCQWADGLTLLLLRHWQKEKGEGRHTLIVAAFRSEEAGPGHPLRRLSATEAIRLGRLGPEATRELAESMAGPLPPEAHRVIERLSEGSPFMAAAALQGLVESGALLPGSSGGWVIDPFAIEGLQSPRHVAAFLSRRMERLPPPVLALLSAAAVLGKEFSPDFAASLAGLGPRDAVEATEEARRRQLIWASAWSGACSFVHDRLRQTLLQRLPEEERRSLHLRAALDLEPRSPTPVFDLAYHYDAAGETARALPYALAAAEAARARHSLDIAEQQYRIARRGCSQADREARFRVALGLGEVLMLRGRYPEASAELEEALSLAEGPLSRARIEGKLGELAFKQDDLTSASQRIEKALRLLGRGVPRWGVVFLLLAAWESFVQMLHSLFPRWLTGRSSPEGAEADLLAVRLYGQLGHAYWFSRGTIPVLWAHLRGLNLAERYQPTRELAQAYSEHAPGMSLLGWFSRGLAYADRSFAIRQSLEDLWGQGQSLHYKGVVLYACSRYEEAAACCREAIRLLGRMGDHWEMNIARFQVAASLYRLGRLPEAMEEAQRIHQSGIDLGDGQASGISLDIWARASGGKIPAGILAAELARPSIDVQRTAQVRLAEAVCLLGQKRPQEAAATLQEAMSLLDRAGVMNAWVSPVAPWLATALRLQAESLSGRLPQPRQEVLARAEQAAQAACRLARQYPNELPHALREAGLMAMHQGKPRRARRLLERSLDAARSQGAAYEAALTTLALAELGVDLGEPGSDASLEAARALVRQLEGNTLLSREPEEGRGKATLSLLDRFDTILEAGRRIASALSAEAVYTAAREAAQKLLRGESCVILKATEGASGPLTPLSGEVLPEVSQELLRRSLASGRAAVFLEGPGQDSSESMVLSGTRSALCAPILARGQLAACFYVTHRQVAGLFGETERRMADFIATLTGAALENAEGFAELRRLNEALEQRVGEIRLAHGRIQEQAALLDKAQDAIAVIGLDGGILYWNRSAERLYGWPSSEAVGQTMEALLSGSATTAFRSAFEATRANGEWSGELRQKTSRGADLIVESRWTLVRDEAGTSRSLLVVSTDVTEKRRLEAQFLRAQRTECIGQLAGGIAHDINNVLTPIVLASQLLRLGGQSPEDRDKILENIEEVAMRGAEMVKQILAYARGTEGRREAVQMRHLLGEMQQVIRHTFPKSITAHVSHGKGLWPVLADATQLHQLLMNLCVNARDAMPEGGALTVTAENVLLSPDDVAGHSWARPGPHVLLSVVDTGTGMTAEVVERIFDPFFTTKEQGKGTGLGMATVLGIVKGHEGMIKIDTAPGRGTRMLVYLPAAEQAPGMPTPPSEPTRAGKQEAILVVDDEPHVLDVAARNLRANGYRVLEARGGFEALDLLRKYSSEVRLVLTDLMMPGMDGAAVVRDARQVVPGLPAVVMSGLPLKPSLGPPEGSQVQGHLQKPFKCDEMLRILEAALSGAVTAPLSAPTPPIPPSALIR
jgi:two-component system sensor kinase